MADGENIIDMGFSDKGEVNLESVIAKRPDLMIAQLRSKPSLSQTGVLDKLKALNVPVLFIDTMLAGGKHAESVTLLGKPSTAKAKPSNIPIIISSTIRPFWPRRRRWNPPLVFFEAKAGLNGLESCCYTHAHVGWGALVEAVGARNIGSALLPGNPHFGALKVEVMRPVPSAVSACRPAPYWAAHGYKPTASSWQIPVTHSVTQTGNGPTSRNAQCG